MKRAVRYRRRVEYQLACTTSTWTSTTLCGTWPHGPLSPSPSNASTGRPYSAQDQCASTVSTGCCFVLQLETARNAGKCHTLLSVTSPNGDFRAEFFFHGDSLIRCLFSLKTTPHLSTLPIKKGKGFPYSTPSVGPGADPGVQAVNLQVTVSHPPGGRLPLLSARPAVTSLAAEHHALWLVPSYHAWWQRHIGVNNLP